MLIRAGDAKWLYVAGWRGADDLYALAIANTILQAVSAEYAEYIERAIREWPQERSEAIEDLIAEKYRGIRPAPGYPACLDHTEKRLIWSLLDVERQIGATLTESYAISPSSSVSGWYFFHPQARYFGVGKIGRDQLEDYASRKGMDVEEMARWLRPNLLD